MRHYHLNHHERLATGFTDVFAIYKADITQTLADEPSQVDLTPIKTGDLVMNDAFLEVITPVTGLTSALGALAVRAVAGPLLGNSNLLAAGSRYYASEATTAPKAAISNGILGFDLTAGAGEVPASLTAGEFRIWISICRKTERNFQA
jgi:hypothetical protein